MKDKPLLHAFHILEAIEKIERFTEGSIQSLLEDEKTYPAVLYSLQTLSESTRFIDQKIRENNPHIPWQDIWGFRNILVHDYLGDLIPEALWEIIKTDLPILKQALEEVYPDWKDRRSALQRD